MILILPSMADKEKKEEPTLTTPELMRKYRWHGQSICDAVDRKYDYSKILDKPIREKKPKVVRENKPRRTRQEEEEPFAELWK